MILDFAPEIVLCIAECLDTDGDVAALVRTNRRLHHLLDPYLYRRNAQSSASSALLWAAKNGREVTARKALDSGADINAQTVHVEGPFRESTPLDAFNRRDHGGGYTPLCLAVRAGNTDMVKLLLAVDGVDVNAHGNVNRQTSLFWTIKAKNDEMFKLLLETPGIDPERRSRDLETPLMEAARLNNVEMVKQLLAHEGVDANTGNWIAKTPIWVASYCGHDEVVRLLLEAGATARQHYDENALSIAAVWGHHAVVKALFASGTVDRTNLSRHIRVMQHAAVKDGYVELFKVLFEEDHTELDWHPGDGKTPLWYAAKGGHEEVVELLLAAGGVNVNTISQRGMAPEVAVEAAAVGYEWEGDGITPLIVAAGKGHVKIVQMLLATEGINVRWRDDCGNTALSAAEEKGHTKIAELIRKALEVYTSNPLE